MVGGVSCLRLVDQVLGASSGFTVDWPQDSEDLGLLRIYGDICSSAGRIPGISVAVGTSPENVEEAIGQIKVTIEEL